MITEKRLEEALKFISETDEEQAKYSSGLEYLKDKKSVELILRSVSNFNNKSIFYDRFETLKIEDVQLLKFN